MNRREVLRLGAASVAAGFEPLFSAVPEPSNQRQVEQWVVFEITLVGPATGNPFKDLTIRARFSLKHRSVDVTGFYDGEGTYRIRFMPDEPGDWTYITESSAPALANKTGGFRCVPPASRENHGPVQVADEFHFQYADRTPFFPFGTTTYAYLFAAKESARLALEGMATCRFNKTRICLLPKPLGEDIEKQMLPFPRTGTGKNAVNDLMQFNPEYFRMVEKRILDLQNAGIEADVILFHPYDAWGYKAMPAEADDFYLRYVIARLSAFRNVWWSVANEYDLVKTKTMSDWDRFFRILATEDPYSHLRSVHHSGPIYDNSKPWVTHASLQRFDFEKTPERRAAWRKPIIYDELQYEGDFDRRWGNLTAEEMTRRFWLAVVYGAFASHGEVFLSETGESSWSDAGRMRGESGARIAFLRSLIERTGKTGLKAAENPYYLNATADDEVILYYFDYHRPARYDFPLPTTGNYSATLIDPFLMTTTALPGQHSGKSRIVLSGRPYQAVLFQKVSENHDKKIEAVKPDALD
jgi:hypothetical protein